MRAIFQRYQTLINQILQWILFGYQATAVVLFLVGIYLGIRWIQTPFLGALVEHTLVFNGTGPSTPMEEWELYRQVLVGDQLVAINDTPVQSAEDMQAILGGFYPGETVSVTIRSESGDERTQDVVLHEFPSSSIVTYFVIPSTLGLIFLAVSLWIFGLRRSEPAGRAFSLFTVSLAIVMGSYFDLVTTHAFSRIWTLSCAMTGGAFIDLGLSFPQEPRAVVKRPYLRWVGIVIAVILFFIAFPDLYNFQRPTAYIPDWQYIYIFVAVSGFFYIGLNGYYAIYAQSPVAKSQSRIILTGTLVSLLPAIIWLVLGFFSPRSFSPFLFLPMMLFPLVIGYTIMRFRFLRTENWARHGVVYLFLAALAAMGYALLVSGAALIFRSTALTDNPFWIGAVVFVLALMLDPVRTRLQGFVDAAFFRGQRAYAERLQKFSHDLTTALDLRSINQILHQQIASTLTPEHIHVYTFDVLNDQFIALPLDNGRSSSDVRFASNGPLAQYFIAEKLPLYLDGSSSLPPSLLSDQSRLALLGARLFLMLPGKGKPIGWVALGGRRSGQAYTPQDLNFLENLCDQASVAIERVQTIANLEHRVQEMNALTRVSQGVNITLTFDDVLELIYAQTAQIIPTSQFHITLYNKPNDYYYYGFCVESGERILDQENLPFPPSTGLSTDVIRKGRPVLTHDHARECQARSLSPAQEGVFAWMGVPLNAGAESIGALSVASTDSGTIYTRGQLDLLHAIADQTAGAIVKARLLQETQQRAHQLSTLNEVTRQLTSTLELEPLLKNILENAVNILNCEAGSLFLIDEQTDELIFKVTAGPVARDLLGQRLAPGSGIVGRAVQSRGPVIENDAQRSMKRFSGMDKQTGFVTRSLLAVPMQVKDRVIGVIEVMNHRDGMPFVEDDQNLLLAFAGQAAVAIENARLYTLTDQELADRVEELSVMQRIDRELNASLEMDRAMRITLEWAMRQSRAEAGLIGVIEENHLQIMAQQGYDDFVASLQNHAMKIEMPSMQTAMETGQPQRVSFPPDSSGGLLAGIATQIVVPIRREANVIGLLTLESSLDSQADMAFLNRLSDHAAIAISNAQLYGEVQRANIAKSEFVSFVAHELKNPMTSIKGYTDLLAKGAVGPITEMQTNFLSTISSNVERMSTLVSDLNDNSKIEAGRLRLEYKAVDVAALVDEAVRSTKRQIEDKKQQVSVSLPEKMPMMWADKIRVGQVLINLVSNAHKYTPESGTIIVGAESAANQWDEESAAKQVIHIWVQDTGIGISVEDQKKIFQKFFRSDDSKARESPGTGLGLNITKSLVEMQGGKIWFDSEFRKGTTFHFTVPVAEG